MVKPSLYHYATSQQLNQCSTSSVPMLLQNLQISSNALLYISLRENNDLCTSENRRTEANELHSYLITTERFVMTWAVIITCVRTASEMDFQLGKKTSLTTCYALKEFVWIHIVRNSNG